MIDLAGKNNQYWQDYKPGEIPTFPAKPPQRILNETRGPILDAGTGDGKLAEDLSGQGYEVYAMDIAKNVITENLKRKSKVNYFIGDITTKNQFPVNKFDLLLFKFTLTSIHCDSWDDLRREVNRITDTGSKLWVLEPMVSKSYEKRYKLAANFVSDPHCVYVFKQKDLAEKITTVKQLEIAINNGLVSRIVKHYTTDELCGIFSDFKLAESRKFSTISPSGYEIVTFEGVFRR